MIKLSREELLYNVFPVVEKNKKSLEKIKNDFSEIKLIKDLIILQDKLLSYKEQVENNTNDLVYIEINLLIEEMELVSETIMITAINELMIQLLEVSKSLKK
jgi:hypothetical protein